MPHHVFNLTEVSAYLHLDKTEIEKLVSRGIIPHERQATRLIFRKGAIDDWASQRILGFSPEHLNLYHRGVAAKQHHISRTHVIVSELVKSDYFTPALPAKTKASLLREVVKLAEITGLVFSPEKLVEMLEEREALCSTALAGGFALLHPRYHLPYMFEDSFVVCGRTPRPMPFSAPDGQLTDLFFLICCQTDRIHLHVLARLCTMCAQTTLLDDLRDASSSMEMFQAILEAETAVIKSL